MNLSTHDCKLRKCAIFGKINCSWEEERSLRSCKLNVEESPDSGKQGTECKLRLVIAGVLSTERKKKQILN